MLFHICPDIITKTHAYIGIKQLFIHMIMYEVNVIYRLHTKVSN